MSKNIAVISNGHGEDLIALTIIQAFTNKKNRQNIEIKVFPLVGKGLSYLKAGFEVSLKNPIFPSSGFIRSLYDLLKDIKHGLLGHILYQKKHIKNQITMSDMVICVGDVFTLWMAPKKKGQLIYFLPTAKSNYFMPHSFFERYYIKYAW